MLLRRLQWQISWIIMIRKKGWKMVSTLPVDCSSEQHQANRILLELRLPPRILRMAPVPAFAIYARNSYPIVPIINTFIVRYLARVTWVKKFAVNSVFECVFRSQDDDVWKSLKKSHSNVLADLFKYLVSRYFFRKYLYLDTFFGEYLKSISI